MQFSLTSITCSLNINNTDYNLDKAKSNTIIKSHNIIESGAEKKLMIQQSIIKTESIVSLGIEHFQKKRKIKNNNNK